MVKGGPGLRLVGLASTPDTVKAAPSSMVLIVAASSPLETDRRCRRLPSKPLRRAVNSSPRGVASRAPICQYSCGLNRSISDSRSQIKRSATDWTRPAERAPGSLRQRTGESVKPTR